MQHDGLCIALTLQRFVDTKLNFGPRIGAVDADRGNRARKHDVCLIHGLFVPYSETRAGRGVARAEERKTCDCDAESPSRSPKWERCRHHSTRPSEVGRRI